MALLDALPSVEEITAPLAQVIGDRAGGTGVAGALGLLQTIDVGALLGSLTGRLDGVVSAGAQAPPGPIAAALARLEEAVVSLPRDPAQLLGPLTGPLQTIQDLALSQLPGKLDAGVRGLQDLAGLVPADLSGLLAGAAEGAAGVKNELFTGALGQLRQWSSSVEGLAGEVLPLLAGGPGTVLDRLIDYLRRKVADAAQALLPKPGGLARDLADRLGAALSPARVASVLALKGQLVGQLNLARQQFDGGDFATATHIDAAGATLTSLTSELSGIAAGLGAPLGEEHATGAGLAAALGRQIDEYAAVEVVDVGNIKERFTGALAKAEEAIKRTNLQAVRGKVEEVFGRLQDVLGRANLGNLGPDVAGLAGPLGQGADRLEAGLLEATSALRSVLGRARQALDGVAAALGTFDAGGQFHFHVEQDVQAFLGQVQSTIEDTVRPLLGQFKTTITGALTQVATILGNVQGQVAGVKTQLQQGLLGVADQLDGLDVPGKIDGLRARLDAMLQGLGDVSFDAVADPVIAQIDAMAARLGQIDVSKLNSITRGALTIAVEVVLKVDFAAHITKVLLDELDPILDLPKRAGEEVRARVQAGLDRLGALRPDALLKPLDDLFRPLTERLDSLELDRVLGPVEAWHSRAVAEVAKVSPANLLQPLVEVHVRLTGTVASLAPSGLVAKLADALGQLKERVAGFDLAGPLGALREVTTRVTGELDRLDPARLLAPVVSAYDTIDEALDNFNPAQLLQPVTNLINQITAPLDNLDPGGAAAIVDAFAPLLTVSTAFDPAQVFDAVRQKYAEVLGLLEQVNVGGILADLRGPFDAMQVSFQAGGAAGAGLEAKVTLLNPLRNDALGQVATAFLDARDRLQAFPQGGPPAELTTRYQALRPRIERLVPPGIGPGLTPSAIRQGLAAANPLNVAAEVGTLYQAVKDQWHALDPRVLQAGLQGTLDSVKGVVAALDPDALAAGVQAAFGRVVDRVNALGVQVLADELDGLFAPVQGIVGGLDPRPVIGSLQALADQVTTALTALKPSELLADVAAPLQTARGVVASFRPGEFAAVLKEAFDRINGVLAKIDVTVLLQPLTDRVDRLRDELTETLKRTETAFNNMLAAIPV